MNFWCWICHNVRTHEMQEYKGTLTEKGKCRSCGTNNWLPMGDTD